MELNECKPSFASSLNNWRKLVIQQDNYTCQICGKKGKSSSLEAHHIVPIEFIQKHQKLYPLAFLIANGMTVHKSCHPEKGRALGEQEAEDLIRVLMGEETWKIVGSLGILDDFIEDDEEVDSSDGVLDYSAHDIVDDIAVELIDLEEEIKHKYRNTVKRRLLALGLDNMANWTREQITEARSYKPNPGIYQKRINIIKTYIAKLRTS